MSTYENQTGRLPKQFLLQRRYIILEQAGRGGMGAVYEAVDTQTPGLRVAIKEMSQGHLSETELAQATQHFQQEAMMLGRLSHPNLPRIYNSFSDRGRSYLVMDFIEGKTLLQLIQEQGRRPLPVAQVLSIANQLCDVLIYLHQQRPPIIFRDLKPANVMVTADGHAFVIDFGIARIFKEGQAQDTVFLGSPGYAPPEQHGSSQTSPRSDLYSLGATLHCCLTGQDPYHATDRFAFAPVRQWNPQVPLELDQLIQRLLALDEKQRPESAIEVQQILRRIGQQASEHTLGLNPAIAASAPTQYNPPLAAPPNLPFSSPPTVPVQRHIPPVSAGQGPQLPLQPGRATGRGSIWTMPFMVLFGLMLVLTLGGSLVVFNLVQASDHIFEAGLSALALLVSLGAIAFVRSLVARAILLLAGLAMVLPGIAFALQAGLFPNNGVPDANLNQLLTGGLLAAVVISLFWLARPLTRVDRFILLALFGVAGVCAVVQFFFRDETVLEQVFSNSQQPPTLQQLQILQQQLQTAVNTEAVPKHILLLFVLIVFIQGVLLAVQMERVHTRTS